MDDVSELRLQRVHPKLAAAIRQMAEQLALEGITIRVTQGLRTWEEQDALYAKGRTTPPLGVEYEVTKAPGGSSWHNFGLAVDCVPMMPLGPDWNETHPVWKRMLAVGLTLGLEEGAGWRTFKDYPHFEMIGSLPEKPNDYVHSAYAEGGIPAVWTAAGMYVPGPYPSGPTLV
jgi:peptidoglycan LD-endopeptidase CwlK